MACSPIIILDAGCLDKEVIQLQCKGSEEAVYYQFSLADRIGQQTLLDVRATANEDDVTISNITVDGQTFKCLISGGTIYHNIGIHFLATTSGGETRTFNAVLPIRPEGVMNVPGDGTVVVMGNAGAPGPKGEQGEKGKDGISTTISVGTVSTLAPDQQATAEIIHGANGEDTLNLGLVKGEQGDKGDVGAPGEAGESYVNNGTTQLDVQSLQLADIQSVDIDDIPENKILLDKANNQLVIKQNNQWVPLNMNVNNNFEIETSYKNNTGTFPINFASDKLLLTGTTDENGVISGYIKPDTTTNNIIPQTLLIRFDFKLTSSLKKDDSLYITQFLKGLSIGVNSVKNTVTVYDQNAVLYTISLTDLSINLDDDEFHTFCIYIKNGVNGYCSFSIDGIFFNKYPMYSTTQTYILSNLRIRGNEWTVQDANVIIVKNIAFSSQIPTLLDGNLNTDYSNYEGYYPCTNGDVNNANIASGILLKSNSNLDCFNSLQPYYYSGTDAPNKTKFNSEGCYGGLISLSTFMDMPTFTFECYFKFNSQYDYSNESRAIIGYVDKGFMIGIPYQSSSELIYTDYKKNINTTLVDDIEKDVWHTLSISCNNNVASIFINGQLKASGLTFDFSWVNIYLRGLKSSQYIVKDNSLIIKNVSLTVGEDKYAIDYDSALTPSSKGQGGFFYPLIDGLFENQNELTNSLELIINDGDSFNLVTTQNNTPAAYISYYPKRPITSNTVVNTKNVKHYVFDIVGNPLKQGV